MPDYSVIESVCQALDITISELMDGEDSDKSSIRVYDEAQIMDLLKRVQELERQKRTVCGILLVVMGLALLAVSNTIGGPGLKDFLSGLLLGISVAEMLAGVYFIGRILAK